MIVNGGTGNDDITVDSTVTVATEVYAGEGHDRIVGGGGYNILVGANGTDTIVGGPLANLIVAGNGGDTVYGGSSNDLVVAGSTAYDSNSTALRAIFSEWTSSRDYTTRINNILGVGVTSTRLNGNYFLTADKVFDDGEIDRITAAGGRDWIFAQLGITGQDVITGLAADELVTDLAIPS